MRRTFFGQLRVFTINAVGIVLIGIFWLTAAVISENVRIIDAEQPLIRQRRQNFELTQSDKVVATVTQKHLNVTHLKDSRKQLMIHWIGTSNAIICLSRFPLSTPLVNTVGSSAVYVSYDNGDSFVNRTDMFKLSNGSYAALDHFYNHRTYRKNTVLIDASNKVLFTTKDNCEHVKRIDLSFTPNEVLFHELQPDIFVVLDRKSPQKELWITTDFGQSFRMLINHVKNVNWINTGGEQYKLVVQQSKIAGSDTVVKYTSRFDTLRSLQWTTLSDDVRDYYVHNKYVFITKQNGAHNLNLYVSNQLSKPVQCSFDQRTVAIRYSIVDVSADVALVAVAHSNNTSRLYVSNGLTEPDRYQVPFTLSLDNVCCFFPNATRRFPWMSGNSTTNLDDSFVDVYKVQGLPGLFIATAVLTVEAIQNGSLQRQHLHSLITYDHGRTWRRIQAPSLDINYDSHPMNTNASLQLSQRFNDHHQDARFNNILSSEGAPGIILAVGTVGTTLHTDFGIYISTDAGVTWRHILHGYYLFNMGDHGGVLTAIRYERDSNLARHILYSTNYGSTWNQTAFHDEELFLYALLTEPWENTTSFILFGSLREIHQWIIIKVDLFDMFLYSCRVPDDYRTWSPSETTSGLIPCNLGKEWSYQQRLQYSNCYNGQLFVAPTMVRVCNCTELDFECDKWFVRSLTTGHCIRDPDHSLYAPRVCPPGTMYNRTRGYRKREGDVCVVASEPYITYHSHDQVACPLKESQHFLLLSHDKYVSRYDIVTKQLTVLPLKDVQQVTGVEFDMEDNCVFWSDIKNDTINRQCLSLGTEPEVLLETDLQSVVALAYDWIAHNLYFVDGKASRIEVLRTDTPLGDHMRTLLLKSPQVDIPRGIAVHPVAGYLFWTDTSADNPCVCRSNLDGTQIRRLFNKPQVVWPNGITVDYTADRVYWVDAELDYIASTSLDGSSGLNIIISKQSNILHPFAIAVFKTLIYWNDWNTTSIYAADKDAPIGFETLATNLSALMDLKVFAHGLHVGENQCRNGSEHCPYVCAAGPNNGAPTCLCPNACKKDTKGHCECPFETQVKCKDYEFQCLPPDVKCIPQEWECDHKADCDHGEDEQNCSFKHATVAQNCSTDMFRCATSDHCLPVWYQCDKVSDCPDGSDEFNCTYVHRVSKPVVTKTCGVNKFRCNDGTCIELSWVCDNSTDCPNSDDETDCDDRKSQIKNCAASGLFKCTEDGSCIGQEHVCNGETDCPDGTDERYCHHRSVILNGADVIQNCSKGYYACDAVCRPLATLCDGKNNCKTGWDESNCNNFQLIYQVLNYWQVETGITETTLQLMWTVYKGRSPTKQPLFQFLPSISPVDQDQWKNKTWTDAKEYTFKSLQSYTEYKMRVYVRLKNNPKIVFSPARYFTARTSEGVPTPPRNVRAEQQNGNFILVQWDAPRNPQGVLSGYKLFWSPPIPPNQIELHADDTAHSLGAHFEPNITYTFYVIAFNNRHESPKSAMVNVLFDARIILERVGNLTVNTTSDSTVIAWRYDNKIVDRFEVDMKIVDPSFPRLPILYTNNTVLRLDEPLSPGVLHEIHVRPMIKTIMGPASVLKLKTVGQPLPSVQLDQPQLEGHVAKLSWQLPQNGQSQKRNVKWIYGVFYGQTFDELKDEPRLNTTELRATVVDLPVCVVFSFGVAIIGPIGYGPLTLRKNVTVTAGEEYPPKDVRVRSFDGDPLRMQVQWSPACSMHFNLTFGNYVIHVKERTTGKVWNVLKPYNNSSPHYSHVFNVSHGGVYDVTIGANLPNAILSAVCTYEAPRIRPPSDVSVFVNNNGTFTLHFGGRPPPTFVHQQSLTTIEPSTYEVLINSGTVRNERNGQLFRNAQSPFHYVNTTSNTYTFAVRIRTALGLASDWSAPISMTNGQPYQMVNQPAPASAPNSATSSSWMLGVTLSVLVGICVVLVFVVEKHRRLRNTFTRFVSSHYDTRSGAATFDDAHDVRAHPPPPYSDEVGADEEDDEEGAELDGRQSRMQGFSDDEPLVIA